ncbi:MAG TPA: gamma-glutamyltransferase, partial [Aeromicrobium sp.]|nr:gamma-glutamyltransferase [Aeromicrobium sp.]
MPTVYGEHGAVCTVDALASAAGLDLLRRGGSAADAAVGANAVLAVTTQHMCGMGGDVLAVICPGRGAAPRSLLAVGRAGSGADPVGMRAAGLMTMPFRDDVRSVTVPGCVDGWLSLHE